MKSFTPESVFERDTLGHVQVTDVGNAETDFDARETERAGHLQLDGFRAYGVRDYHGLKYAAEYFNGWPDLVTDTVNRATTQATQSGRAIPKQVTDASEAISKKTLRVVLNSAPRNQRLTENVNGLPFLVVVTKSGVEFHCTPAEALGYIGSDIERIYLNPTETNPLFTAEEQFRSRTTGVTAHFAPENLKLLWDRKTHSIEELNAVIKPPEHDEVGYIDEPFHNRRIMTPDIGQTWEQIDANAFYDGTVRIKVGKSAVRAYIAQSLRTIPEGKWGVYRNPADIPQGPGHFSAYELTRRYDEGKDHNDDAQDPTQYLRKRDQRLGAPVEILPKTKARRAAHFVLSNVRQAAASVLSV